MSKCGKDCMCKINFDEDNGYEYILSELKSTRDQIDKIISLMESRQTKDALINKVLNTEYDDEDNDKEEDEALDIDTLLKILTFNKTFPYSDGYIYKGKYPRVWYERF